MIFNRLAIGTANWGKEYNGTKVSEEDQKKILGYCQCSGIDMIDTAVAYKWDWSNISTSFDIVTKGDGNDEFQRKPYGYLAHTGVIWAPFRYKWLVYKSEKVGLSIYELKDIPYFGTFGVHLADIIQVPYSIFDRRFERYFPEWKDQGIEIHVRSIFLRGKLLDRFRPWECIAFCLMNPCVDRVILGADSYEQFKDNLKPFHKMNTARIDDEKILNPMKWAT